MPRPSPPRLQADLFVCVGRWGGGLHAGRLNFIFFDIKKPNIYLLVFHSIPFINLFIVCHDSIAYGNYHKSSQASVTVRSRDPITRPELDLGSSKFADWLFGLGDFKTAFEFNWNNVLKSCISDHLLHLHSERYVLCIQMFYNKPISICTIWIILKLLTG